MDATLKRSVLLGESHEASEASRWTVVDGALRLRIPPREDNKAQAPHTTSLPPAPSARPRSASPTAGSLILRARHVVGAPRGHVARSGAFVSTGPSLDERSGGWRRHPFATHISPLLAAGPLNFEGGISGEARGVGGVCGHASRWRRTLWRCCSTTSAPSPASQRELVLRPPLERAACCAARRQRPPRDYGCPSRGVSTRRCVGSGSRPPRGGRRVSMN